MKTRSRTWLPVYVAIGIAAFFVMQALNPFGVGLLAPFFR